MQFFHRARLAQRSFHRARLALVPLALAACTGGPTEPSAPPPALTALPRALTPAEQSVIGASNAFAFALFGRVSASQADSNVFVSPLSASMSLGMTMNGAAGKTFDDMRSALQFGTASQADIDAGYRSLIKLLTSLDPAVQMQIANSIWYDRGFPVYPSFLDTAKTYFDAGGQALDFTNGPSAVNTINDWVNKQTNGTIPSLLDGLEADEVMFLVNAMYFKGKWRERFDASSATGSFHAAGGSVQSVPFMHRGGTMAYASGAGWQAVDLPYGDSAFSMTVILPSGSVDALVDSLTPELWNSLTASLASRQVDLKLPRLTLTYSRKLNDDLQALGMRAPFDRLGADFSRMSPVAGLYITRVQQKTFVRVNEEGTEASAATYTGIGVTSLPLTTEMTVDRPYLFVIRERLSGTVLFMGKITRIPAS